MIDTLVRFSLHQRVIVILMAVVLAGWGLFSLSQLKVEAYPDISDTQTVIITQFNGRAAEEVEQQVTVPIERALNAVPNVIARRSRTIFGLSVVELTFAYGTDDYFARQVVLEKLRDADLPEGVTPTLGALTTPIGELYRFTLAGGGLDTARLRELEDWVVAPRLMQVPGVADIMPFGGLVKQYQIEVSPQALSKYDLSIAEIAKAVHDNNSNTGGATLDNGQQSLVIRGVGQIQTIDDIQNIVVTEAGGVPIFVKNVGTVRIGAAVPTGIFGLNAHSGGIEGVVLMRRGENPSDILDAVRDAMDEINESKLPPGVRLTLIYDRAELVNSTLRTVTHTLYEGLAIVILVLLFFLGSFRAALLTAVTIPLSLLFAFICMKLTGIPANLLSLGALDFGIIVDATLVMVEHVLHTLHHREHEEGFWQHGGVLHAVRDAALEVAKPIFFSLAIIISAYIPLFTLERVERKLFTPMAFTVSYALLGSLLLALTLIPVLATFLFRRNAKAWNNPLVQWVQDGYGRLVANVVRRPVPIAAVAGLAVAGGFGIATLLGVEFLPSLDEGMIWIRATLPPGTSLEKSAQVASQIRGIVTRYPEVKLVASQTGRNDSGTDPYGPNRNELLVPLQPYPTWKNGRVKADLINDLSRDLNRDIPGASFTFTQPIIDSVTEAVTGSSADLAVIIRGPDLVKLRELGRQTLGILQKVPGSADTGIEQEDDQPQLRIRLDRQAIARYGINVSDVQDDIEIALGGRAASTMFEGERRFDITVRYAPESRADLTAIGAVLIPTKEGGRVPLSELAEIKVVRGASIIARRENQRQISVRANIRGRDQGSFVKEAQARFQREMKIPAGYVVDWGGQFENLQRAQKRLTFILPITIAIIYVLLFFLFDSPLQAALVLMNVPFSLVGGFLFLWMRGINLSVSAAVGFISLFGVAVMSGVLVLAEINRVRRVRPELGKRAAIVEGARAQLRPVLLMVIVALLGMVPAARATGIGSDVQRPLATVLVGGLLSTLVLTLFALPAMCSLLLPERPTSDGV